MRPQTHTIEPEEIMAYLDGELPIEAAARIAAHLGQCPDCQSIADDLKQVSLSTLSWQIEPHSTELPVALDEALYKLSFEPTSTPVKPSWLSRLSLRSPWIWAGIPAGALAAVLLVIVAFNQPQPSTKTVEEHRAIAPQPEALASPMMQSAGPPVGILSRQSRVRGMSAAGFPSQASAPPPASTPRPASTPPVAPPQQPLIARSVQLNLTAADLDRARLDLDVILSQHHGYLGNLDALSTAGKPRSLNATLRVPAGELDSTLASLKNLGHVEFESQNGEEVTAQYVDLDARIRNARNTESRLTDLLDNRTGRLSDVLEVETEISSVRGEIEQMESQKKLLETRVALSSIHLTINEQFKAQAQIVPDSTATRLRNAAIDGYRTATNSVLSVLLFLISAGPTLLLWAAILFFPARYLWKKRPWRQTP